MNQILKGICMGAIIFSILMLVIGLIGLLILGFSAIKATFGIDGWIIVVFGALISISCAFAVHE